MVQHPTWSLIASVVLYFFVFGSGWIAHAEQISPTTVLPFGTAPIPLQALATDFPPPSLPEDAASIEAIRNTLALYPLAIDGKNFAALGRIFKKDAIANYSAPINVLTGLSQIESVLTSSLHCVTTQHLYGTQLIEVLGPTVAVSVTYYRAAHFGLKNQTSDLTSDVVYAYGQYQDTWQKQPDLTWKIVYRNLVYMVSFGQPSVPNIVPLRRGR